ncbi:MAG: YitT family protein [Lachnospiraceae bacterium]|nr:YitT family protein [Lachnospiraceae bacterium]
MSGKEKISSYGVITIGTFLMAIGVNLIYEPMSMVTGGFAGIGIILYRFFQIPIWITTTVLNIPLFFLAGKKFGMAFVKKTLYAAVCFSVALAVIPTLPTAYEDYLMAALLGGALNGAGLSLVFGKGSSTGGSDLLSTLLQPVFPWLTAGTLLSVIDGIIVVAGMLVFGIRTGLYAIVAVFITTKLMDRILEGLKFAKLLYIISEQPETIAGKVMEELDRGVTALSGRGMYSKRVKNVLMCAVSRKQAVAVIRIVKKADKRAFIIISDAREVMGEGFTYRL